MSPPPAWNAVLRVLRDAQGITQDGWAARLGYSRRTVVRWEQGDLVPDAAAEAAIVACCADAGAYRSYTHGSLEGLALTPEFLHTLLAQARLGSLTTPVSRRFEELPTPLTSLVGRDRDLSELVQRVTTSRFVTLTGPGGVGKTRLAIEAARAAQDAFSAGVCLVDLASLRDPALVLFMMAQALGVPETPGQTLLESLRLALRDKPLLMVLDNFEQVAEAASSVATLLEACPPLHVLITSRMRLNLAGEREYQVPALAIPDTADVSASGMMPYLAAVDLFVQRAQAVKPDFHLTADTTPLIVEICRRLDGLPLAIELAAARCKILTPGALLERLDHRLQLLTGGPRNRPARQQTLRNAIAWSYALLTPAEQWLFRRLAVFVGSCALTAAEAVGTGGTAADGTVLDQLSSLVDKSLLIEQGDQGGTDNRTRFRMLATIQDFAREELERNEEGAAASDAHAAYFMTLVETSERRLASAHGIETGFALLPELSNLRAAMRWLLERGEAEPACRLVGSLLLFLYRHAPAEGRQWAEATLRLPVAASATPALAMALHAAAITAFAQRDFAVAAARARESVAVWHELGDTRREGEVLCLLAQSLPDDGGAALATAEAGVALLRNGGFTWELVGGLTALGAAQSAHGNDAQGEQTLWEAVALGRSLGERWRVGIALYYLGQVTLARADYTAARGLFEESLSLMRMVGDTGNVAFFAERLGVTILHQGEVNRAVDFIEESLRLRRELGLSAGVAMCVEAFGQVALAVGQPAAAVQLFGAADSWRRQTASAANPWIQRLVTRDVGGLRETLGVPAFTAAWAAGTSLSLEQAVAYAREHVLARRPG